MADQNEPGTVQMGTISGGGMRIEGAPETQIPPVEEAMPKAMTIEERIANLKKNRFPKGLSETRDWDWDYLEVSEVMARHFENPATTLDELRQLIPNSLFLDRLRGGTFLHWAVRMEDIEMVKRILVVEAVDVYAKDVLWRATALHWAIRLGNMPIIEALLPKCAKDTIEEIRDRWGFNAGDYAFFLSMGILVSGKRENIAMVRELLKLEGIRLFEECERGQTPLQIAHKRDFRDIQKALMEKDPVRRYVDDLYRDRQVYVDAANAILVGAALIASVTFASWLQPPMGYIDPGYAKVQHNRGLQAFWVFNSLSFYFAIATVVFGARSVLPRGAYFIKRTVEKLRKNLLATAVLLACSVFCVIIAFGIAGSIVLKPEVEFQMYMIVPTVFGGLVCIISLALLCKSMWEDSFGRASVANRAYEWSNHLTWF